MRLIFGRHGETDFNRDGRMNGCMESSLTSLGKRQAKALARYCAGIDITRIYCSDTKRAYETALEVNKTIKIIKDKLLREICYGSWEGKYKKDLRKTAPWQEREKNKYTFVLPGNFHGIKGESYKQQYDRLTLFLNQINRKCKESGVILIISHMGICKNAMMAFNSLQEEEFGDYDFPNNKLFVVDLDGGKVTGKREVLF